jgi:hypothetical protein
MWLHGGVLRRSIMHSRTVLLVIRVIRIKVVLIKIILIRVLSVDVFIDIVVIGIFVINEIDADASGIR